MSYQTVFNPGDAPVGLGDTGRTVGGGEWAPVNGALVSDDVDAGRLVLVEVPDLETATELDPAARAAFDQTVVWGERLTTVTAFDKDTCQALAARAGLIEDAATDDTHVADLRTLLVESDADLTRPAQAKKQAAAAAAPTEQKKD